MMSMVVKKEESAEMSDISEPGITVDPVVTFECEVSSRVFDYYLDELDDRRAGQIADHLVTCSYCQNVYDTLERVIRMLRKTPEQFFPDEMAVRRAEKNKPSPKTMGAAG